jgi:hypothetical protein
MTSPNYISREELMAAADVAPSALVVSQLDRILSAVSRQTDETMRRRFYPTFDTRTFFPDGDIDPDTHLWSFDVPDLLSVSTVTVDGVATLDYRFTDLGDNEPPYSRIALTGRTGEQVTITGEWGYTDAQTPAGTLSADLNGSSTAVLVSNSYLVGVGDMIRIGTERMIVTNKAFVDTGDALSSGLAALASANAVAVTDGTDFAAGEVILINTERMLITDVIGNTLVVDRAVQGSTLAAHDTADDIYAPRSLTVERGAAGSTAASHTTGAAVSRFYAPHPIRSLVLAEALVAYEQEKGAYGRVIGSGEGQREASGKGLADVRKRARIYRRARWVVI